MIPQKTQPPGDPSRPINLNLDQQEELSKLIEILRNEIDERKRAEKDRTKNEPDMPVVAGIHI